MLFLCFRPFKLRSFNVVILTILLGLAIVLEPLLWSVPGSLLVGSNYQCITPLTVPTVPLSAFSFPHKGNLNVRSSGIDFSLGQWLVILSLVCAVLIFNVGHFCGFTIAACLSFSAHVRNIDCCSVLLALVGFQFSN